ncbi:hypothetical protein P256_02377 [Acinetobacter nectaris CIP 110549]|uniref:HTH tetR-type domain-containing protein n=1 Tax=Acinetobacter nectaris CIP 110549 TaxID=1392540 RepID=V2TIM6_9GAMM|nr:TetR/AcrR family transcriptional regulator [Acinetobacter nectaris]ESK37322.1 hypothetical protein P256_02377 [Acinetobacter nectaris CIP 110549]
MARPLSEEKRVSILDAATVLIAEQGLNVSTSKIARLAKVSEGTIFTYFQNKDELINQLYLDIKGKLRESLIIHSQKTELQKQIQEAWKVYINWGLENPNEYKTLATLSLSSVITDVTKAKGNDAFCDISNILKTVMQSGQLKNQSSEYVGAIMGAMANTTIEFIKLNNAAKEELLQDSFLAFWRVVSNLNN